MSITLLGAGEMETDEIVVNAKYLKAFLMLFTALLFKKKSLQILLNSCVFLSSTPMVIIQVCGIRSSSINQVRM